MIDLDRASRFLAKLHIRDRDTGRRVPFRLNPNQAIAVELLKQQTSAKRPLRAIIVKSRRVGMSSLTEGLMTTYNLSNPLIDSRIVAHLDDSVGKLFSIPTSLVNDLRMRFPTLNIPKPTSDRIIIPHNDGNSELTIATAGTTAGGRGGGFYFLHLSEAAFYTSPDALTSLLSTVPDHENTAVFIESTAFGKVGIGEAFYKRWCAAVAGDSEYLPIFLSWRDDPACVSNPDILKRRDLDDEEKVLAKILTPEQLAWRRITLQDKCEGSIDRFNQEYPLVANDAFVSTGSPAFTREEMRLAQASIKKPIFRGLLTRSREYEKSDRGPLLVWAKPEPGHRYYLGADAARGEDEGGDDFAAIVIVDGTTNEVVARWAEKVGAEALAAVIDTLGREYNLALVIIEKTGNLGLWAQTVLRDRFRYSNIYKALHLNDRARRTNNVNATLGWETNVRSREIAFTAFRESIRETGLEVRDEQLVGQMDLAQRVVTNVGWRVKRGHDDILFAALLANVAALHYPPPLRNAKVRKPGEEEEKPRVNYKLEGITVDEKTGESDVTAMLKRHVAAVKRYDKDLKRKRWLEGI